MNEDARPICKKAVSGLQLVCKQIWQSLTGRYISKLQKHLTTAKRDLVLPPSSAFEELEGFCYVGMSIDSLSSVLVKICSERKYIFHWHNTRTLAARRAKDSCPGEDTVGARTYGLREKAYRTPG